MTYAKGRGQRARSEPPDRQRYPTRRGAAQVRPLGSRAICVPPGQGLPTQSVSRAIEITDIECHTGVDVIAKKKVECSLDEVRE